MKISKCQLNILIYYFQSHLFFHSSPSSTWFLPLLVLTIYKWCCRPCVSLLGAPTFWDAPRWRRCQGAQAPRTSGRIVSRGGSSAPNLLLYSLMETLCAVVVWDLLWAILRPGTGGTQPAHSPPGRCSPARPLIPSLQACQPRLPLGGREISLPLTLSKWTFNFGLMPQASWYLW